VKIIFHERYYNSSYAADPAAAPGRLEGIMKKISADPSFYEILTPTAASEEDILRAHGAAHVRHIKENTLLYELASLAAGGAIRAAQEGFRGNPAFAVIRPPGHHASSDSCWGFCYFNNMAISLLKLHAEKKIRSAFVLDFDLHTGDGNINILEGRGDGLRVRILNPGGYDRGSYLSEVEEYMRNLDGVDIFAASAGFDQGVEDWGGLLHAEDYREIGRLMKHYSRKICDGRRYAILEGGYNHEALAENVEAFCRGFA